MFMECVRLEFRECLIRTGEDRDRPPVCRMLVVFPEYFADNEPEAVRRFGRDLRRNFQRIPNCRRSTLQIDPCEFEITDAGNLHGRQFPNGYGQFASIIKKSDPNSIFCRSTCGITYWNMNRQHLSENTNTKYKFMNNTMSATRTKMSFPRTSYALITYF